MTSSNDPRHLSPSVALLLMWGISVSRLFGGRSGNAQNDTTSDDIKVDREDACTAADALEALVAILRELPGSGDFSGTYESRKLANTAENIRQASGQTDALSRVGATDWEVTLRGILNLPKE